MLTEDTADGVVGLVLGYFSQVVTAHRLDLTVVGSSLTVGESPSEIFLTRCT